MNDDEFEAELQFATSMRKEPQRALYWTGYRRGLLRARFGRRFSSNTNHFAWREFHGDEDPPLAELGRGYLDGLNCVINGRPSAAKPVHSESSSKPAGDRYCTETDKDDS